MLKYKSRYTAEETKKRWAELSELTKPMIHESANQASRGILIYKTEGADGETYGVLQEGGNFFIKTSSKKIDEATNRDFDYIGGIANANKEKFSNYPKALRRLNVKLHAIKEAFQLQEPTDGQDAPIDSEEDLLNQLDSAEQVKDSEDAADDSLETSDDFDLGSDMDMGSDAGDSLDSLEDAGSEMGDDSLEGDSLEGDLPDESLDSEMDGSAPELDDNDSDGETSENGDGGTDDVLETLGRLGSMLRSLPEMTPELTNNILNTTISNSKSGLEKLDDSDVNKLVNRIKKRGKKGAEDGEDSEGANDDLSGNDNQEDTELDEASFSAFNDPDYEGHGTSHDTATLDQSNDNDITFTQFCDNQQYDGDDDATVAGAIVTYLKLYSDEISEQCFNTSLDEMKQVMNPALLEITLNQLSQEPELQKYVDVLKREFQSTNGLNESYITKLIRKLVTEEKNKLKK